MASRFLTVKEIAVDAQALYFAEEYIFEMRD